jgi:transcriptional regulator with XRE-family HTH domain
MDGTSGSHDERRRAFAAFLRSRRERLVPSEVGLPNGFRRRTSGLRREEVAQLAGVGVTWSTWLEQGRRVSPSAEVLDALATALRLDAA